VILFWILAALMTALAGLGVLSAARRGVDAGGPGDADLASRELAELDRLRDRGLLEGEAHRAARAEAGRRLLGGGGGGQAAPTARAPDRWIVLGSIAGAAAVGLGLYAVVGAPGMPDQAYERRVDDWAGSIETLEPPQIAAVVARVVEERPGDHQALTMLGAARFEAGDPLGAASAFRRALAIQPKDAQSWARLGESLVRSQDGVVGIDAEAAFREAVRLDEGQLGARYFLGLAAIEGGDVAQAQAWWAPLFAVLGPADPRRAELNAALAGAQATP